METELEHILVSAYKDDMIAYLNSHPEYFDEAVMLAISDKQPYAWRAAWLLWSCIKENDKRIKKHIKKIIEAIKIRSGGHKRELLKILYLMDLDEEQEGKIFNICSEMWTIISNVPSMRFIAFRLMLKIAEKHPELKHEIFFLTQDQYMESLSAAAQKSIYKMIKNI